VKKARASEQLPRPIAILDQDENGITLQDQYLLTMHTLADVRSLLRRVPRQKRLEAKWQHVEASLRESAEDAAVALQIALQLDHVPYSVESGLKGRKK
jgi:heme exporter protein D